MRALKYFQVVVEGAHPGRHLLLLGPGKKTDVLAHRHRCPGDHDLPVAPGVEGLGEAGGEREQGLAASGRTHQGDEIDALVAEEIEGEVLFAIPRVYAPYRCCARVEVARGPHPRAVPVRLAHDELRRPGALPEEALVGQPSGRMGSAYPKVILVLVPVGVGDLGIGRQLLDSAVERSGIFEHSFPAAVPRREAREPRPNPQTCIRGDDRDQRIRRCGLGGAGDGEYPVSRAASDTAPDRLRERRAVASPPASAEPGFPIRDPRARRLPADFRDTRRQRAGCGNVPGRAPGPPHPATPRRPPVRATPRQGGETVRPDRTRRPRGRGRQSWPASPNRLLGQRTPATKR